MTIHYRQGYKYQTSRDFVHPIDWYAGPTVKDNEGGFITLRPGLLVIRAGYAWDGPSGPTIDTDTFMSGSLVHDALYQLIREKRLATDPYRKLADEELWRMCKAAGMNPIRAWWVYQGVRLGGGPAARGNPYPVWVAP